MMITLLNANVGSRSKQIYAFVKKAATAKRNENKEECSLKVMIHLEWDFP